MKKISKNLSREVLSVLNKDASFKDAHAMVINRANTKPLLVGGKLYRTIVEILYGYPAKSHSCDFDFAAEKVIKKKRKDWYKTPAYGTVLSTNAIYISSEPQTPEVNFIYDRDNTHMITLSGAPVDLINIGDLTDVRNKVQPNSIEGYFACVPLSIQAIAMDIERCEIFGKAGIESINEKYVWINNENALETYCKIKNILPKYYLKDKATSIKFGCHFDKSDELYISLPFDWRTYSTWVNPVP
jgi:hypothetical protein